MPKYLRAHQPRDAAEKQRLRKLAGSKRAPADQVARARTIVYSLEGADTATIAARLGCHPQTVRDRIARFNEVGLASIVEASSGGRKPRLTAPQRSELVEMVTRLANEQPFRNGQTANSHGRTGATEGRSVRRWSLDSLVAKARERGIEIGRSQLRRVLLESGVEWQTTHAWRVRQPPMLDREQA
jgi:transposase